MDRVGVTFTDALITDEGGKQREGVLARCARCTHTSESFGRGLKSRNRCLVVLNETCPRQENNFYVNVTPGTAERGLVLRFVEALCRGPAGLTAPASALVGQAEELATEFRARYPRRRPKVPALPPPGR
jgi:hypothetical protein